MKRVEVLSRENLASLSSRKPGLPEIELSARESKLEIWDMPLYHMPYAI